MNNSTNIDKNLQKVSEKREPVKAKFSDEEKQDLWSVLLNNASQGKRLPEKSLIVLGIEFKAT